MIKKKILAWSAILCSMSITQAQQTTTTAGGAATGMGGTATYSIGQVVYTTNSSATGTAAQGVQQAFDISVISATKDAEDITLSCMAYPNPTTDVLVLQVDKALDSQFTATLSDANGRELAHKIVTDSKTLFEMSLYAAATYYLQVSNVSGIVKQFKIVKQ